MTATPTQRLPPTGPDRLLKQLTKTVIEVAVTLQPASTAASMMVAVARLPSTRSTRPETYTHIMADPDEEKPRGLGPPKPDDDEPDAGKRPAEQDRLPRGQHGLTADSGDDK